MLETLKSRAQQTGAVVPAAKQRHGEIVESLREVESTVRLFVLGKRGESAQIAEQHLGRTIERVVRSLHRPILVVPPVFTPPRNILIAFDGSATTRSEQLEWAAEVFRAADIETSGGIVSGHPDAVLTAAIAAHDVSLLVMGAYGHSRIRHVLLGSTTTTMLRTTHIPLLLLR